MERHKMYTSHNIHDVCDVFCVLWRYVIRPLFSYTGSYVLFIRIRHQIRNRGVSWLSRISKLWAVLKKQIMSSLENNDILADKQNGFRKNRPYIYHEQFDPKESKSLCCIYWSQKRFWFSRGDNFSWYPLTC